MDEIKDILYDDIEAKYLLLQNKKKNRKKRRKRFQLIFFIGIIVFCVLYVSSDFSKVKSLGVEGNTFYTKEEVLKKAGLSYDTRYIFMPKFYMEWKLEKDKIIDKVEVYKGLNGVITLTVKEKPMIGYLVENGKNYVLLEDASKFEIKSTYLATIVNFPLIDGFDQVQLKKLAKGFKSNKVRVKATIMQMISEITPYQTSYDQHMVKIVMQDGNTVYTAYDSIILLNNYVDTIKGLKKDRACLWPDIQTGSIQSLDCASKE